MKIYVESIKPREDSTKHNFMNVKVRIHDDHSRDLVRNAVLDIFVDKSNKTLDEIKSDAKQEALNFLSEIQAVHHP